MSQRQAGPAAAQRHLGKREARLVVAQDIGRKVGRPRRLAESEARLRSLIEGLPQLVWRASADGGWLWTSPQWRAFTGLSDLESAAEGWLDAVHPDDREMTHAALRDALGFGALYLEHRLRHADSGEWRWFQTRTTAIRAADGALVEWMGACADIDALRRLKDNEVLLVQELQHRTRNLMAVVQAISGASEQGSVSIADYRRRFRTRIDALARTQTLLSEAHGNGVPLESIVRGELRALRPARFDSEGPHVTLDGPASITIKRRHVQILGLAIHELATNAAKHGAFSRDSGRLHVRWNGDDGGRIWLHWIETGVYGLDADARKGFGREVIEDALTFQLAATVDYDLSAGGLTCRIAADIGAP